MVSTFSIHYSGKNINSNKQYTAKTTGLIHSLHLVQQFPTVIPRLGGSQSSRVIPQDKQLSSTIRNMECFSKTTIIMNEVIHRFVLSLYFHLNFLTSHHHCCSRESRRFLILAIPEGIRMIKKKLSTTKN